MELGIITGLAINEGTPVDGRWIYIRLLKDGLQGLDQALHGAAALWAVHAWPGLNKAAECGSGHLWPKQCDLTAIELSKKRIALPCLQLVVKICQHWRATGVPEELHNAALASSTDRCMHTCLVHMGVQYVSSSRLCS